MSRKSKFNLLSFLIEEKLIFYKSINNTKKLIAFSILRTNNILRTIVILNELLNKRLIKAYSIQIQINSKLRERFLLYFEGHEKERILTTFNLIYHTLKKEIKSLFFFKEKKLRREFVNIFSNKITPQSDVVLQKKVLTVKHNQNSLLIKCFQIKLNLINNRIAFLHTLIQLLKKLNSSGFLIFNLRINDYNEIFLNSYYVSTSKKEHDINLDLENEINSLYEAPIFRLFDLKLNSLFKILWRRALNTEFSIVKEILDLFKTFSIYDFQNLSLFIAQLQRMCKLNKLEVHKLNPNLLHVEPSTLFLIINNMDMEKIEKIITKYKSTYKIYLIDLSNMGYNANVKLDKIESIKNLRLLTFKDIISFDFSKLKENYN